MDVINNILNEYVSEDNSVSWSIVCSCNCWWLKVKKKWYIS